MMSLGMQGEVELFIFGCIGIEVLSISWIIYLIIKAPREGFTMNHFTSVTMENGSLVLRCRYDPGLVADLKVRIPYESRRWAHDRKVWLVDAQYVGVVDDLIREHLGEIVELPETADQSPDLETLILDVRYVGATKDRGDGGERTAFGWSNGEWSVIFPESALREYFDAPGTPAEQGSFYSVLGVKRDVKADDLKAAFRRLARQWHPDVCKEPDAATQFITIKNAYDMLSDPGTRARYDAGLALAGSVGGGEGIDLSSGYRAPLRCGQIMVESIYLLGRIYVNKILLWQDIIDPLGRTLVVSWPRGADTWEEVWV